MYFSEQMHSAIKPIDIFIDMKERYQDNHRLVNPDCSTGQVGSSKYIKNIMVII